ncbi:hypothetical protein BD413DRAFT_546093 [Trametes elegans]|nr:hypothetical protein BD413DRAFT_546093 [Trametes elegans]
MHVLNVLRCAALLTAVTVACGEGQSLAPIARRTSERPIPRFGSGAYDGGMGGRIWPAAEPQDCRQDGEIGIVLYIQYARHRCGWGSGKSWYTVLW